MSETTGIEWATHTGGPWLGCSMVSPGCTNCYAMTLAESRLERVFRAAYAGFTDGATRPVWGDKAPRVITKGFWSDARRLNRKHEKAGTRGRWFPSMIDWLDDMPAGIVDQDGNALNPAQVLGEFLAVVAECQSLDFLLLTKRPENWMQRMRWAHQFAGRAKEWLAAWIAEGDEPFSGATPSNVWIGTSIEDQDRLYRHEYLMQIPARLRFWSVEPMLGRIDPIPAWAEFGKPDWIISGGESGENARPMSPEWAKSLMQDCWLENIPFFHKQNGEWAPIDAITDPQAEAMCRLGKVECDQFHTDTPVYRVGKKLAGALLGGKMHRAFPTPK